MFYIIQSLDDKNLLNKKSELVNKCRLQNFVVCRTFFSLKHLFFQSQFAYLASFYTKTLNALNEFFFWHLSKIESGLGHIIKMFTPIVTTYNIIKQWWTMNIFIAKLHSIKLKKTFLTSNQSTHFTCYIWRTSADCPGTENKLKCPHFLNNNGPSIYLGKRTLRKCLLKAKKCWRPNS